MFSQAEENYLKVIFTLQMNKEEPVSTNLIAERLSTKPSSVTDMIKKLSAKELLSYQPYQGVQLTGEGRDIAVKVLRKHRLWEYFLVEKLHYKWDEVHEIAEQLEHIRSDSLTEKLDYFLGLPKFDPHGDPIPDKDGNLVFEELISLKEMEIGEKGILKGLKDSSDVFLKYLDRKNMVINDQIEVAEIENFDGSILIKTNWETFYISKQVAEILLIKRMNDEL
jgi:DtxR family Mn-dependent transcriptional regulator